MSRCDRLLRVLKLVWNRLRRRPEVSKSESHDQIARRRIAEARANKAIALDLGDLELQRLPAEISSLHDLAILSLGVQTHCFVKSGNDAVENLRWQFDAERSCSPLKDISALATLENLQALSLAHCVELRQFDVLTRLPKLRNLDLRCASIEEASWLDQMTHLESLNLDGAQLTRPDSLSALTALKRLQISNQSKLKDLSFLGSAQNLEWLNLWACFGLTDVSQLRHFKNLRGLVLDQCSSLIDTTPVSECAALERLSFCMCLRTLERLPDLSALQKLWQLHLAGCCVLKDFDGIRNATSLRWLNIETCRMPASALKLLTNLSSLFMDRRTEIRVVADMPRLQELRVCRSPELEDLTPLKTLMELRHLDLSRNTRIADWSPLRELMALESLDVSYSSFNDFFTVEALPRLRSFNLQGCYGLEQADLRQQALNDLAKMGIPGQHWMHDLSDSSGTQLDSAFHW